MTTEHPVGNAGRVHRTLPDRLALRIAAGCLAMIFFGWFAVELLGGVPLLALAAGAGSLFLWGVFDPSLGGKKRKPPRLWYRP